MGSITWKNALNAIHPSLGPKDTLAHLEQELGLVPPRDAEIERLNTRLDALGEELRQAERRAQRLMGERNQLAALAERYEKQLQDLNRELGSYQRYGPKDTADEARGVVGGSLIGRLRAWLAKPAPVAAPVVVPETAALPASPAA